MRGSVFVVLLLITASTVAAFQVRPKTSRFDALAIEDPNRSLDVATTPVASLAPNQSLRTAWDGFRASHGPAWSVYLDRRSGAPMLVEGQGIPWIIPKDATVDSLATSLRAFVAGRRHLLLADPAELVLDYAASGQPSPDVWQISFGRAIAGVPVSGERYVFTIGHGNLIAFGAPRWSRIEADTSPTIDAQEAFARMAAYMGLSSADTVTRLRKGRLELIPRRADGGPAVGSGYGSALVWRMAVHIEGEPGTWEALVDAHTGQIRSFGDINDYAQAKGGVYPVSNDQIPTDGVEQAGWPLPYATITSGTTQTSTASGFFACDGTTATTALAGPYVKVVDTCGPILQSVTCDHDLDLATSTGTDCAVPPGSSAGNTHASRTGFYHLNRIAEHARVWLPTRTWLSAQLTNNVNLNQTCNAYWNGVSVNFFKSGGGCSNSGEIAGVFLHEWGHGLDANDGGGLDNPSEAYADITAMMSTHLSCVGRGLREAENCDGYGDACLNCTGIRDQDWDQHASHTPATPSEFLTAHCAIGDGPCGREEHCESYVGAETLWDLATRDLPAAGLDPASSWQLADKLWYKSRLGSGGNAYNCALPSSDGCSATSWFVKLRVIDDDDGNLANGTPHAAAIFAAFNRHKIACGAAGDASNQNSSSCPAIGATVMSATAGPFSVELHWSPVANAVGYNILRNDQSCAAGSTIIATIPGTTFTDSGLANGFAEYYAVQAVGTNGACDGRLSNCLAVIPQPFAGVVKLGAGAYSCSASIAVTVVDGNIGAATTTVKLTSATEPAGETITLTRIAPGSLNYTGTIGTTGSPAAADGLLSLVHGDTITATYVDTNDGQGGLNLPRMTTAAVDCLPPIISSVTASNLTGSSARITWTTNEAATSVVRYGLTPPPGSTAGVPAQVVAHTVDVTGIAECSTYRYSVESADAVGNSRIDNNDGLYYTFSTSANVQPIFPYTGSPVAIPDNTPTGATATIVVPDNKSIVDLNVTIGSITHTFDGDIALHLIGPDNTDVMLSNKRGSSGQNYTNTVFDDSGTIPISAGTAPFTGTFTPESPLSAFVGKNAQGTWKLLVVDNSSADSGTIGSFSLNMTFPSQACNLPHAGYNANALVADTCVTGGSGSGNGAWESGEQVQFKINISADGTAPLTNVSATIDPTTPGITVVDGTAVFPNLAVGASADSNAPHFTVKLPTDLACGSAVAFQATIHSDQGSWPFTFSHAIGAAIVTGGTAVSESFTLGIPASWTIVNGGAGGNAGATTWTTANPGGRPIAAPMVAPVAMVDSDFAGDGAGVVQDEQLITPAMDFSTATSVTLQFDQFFRWFQDGFPEVADVDVLPSPSSAWVNVLRQQGASSSNPDHKSIDISAQAAGAANARVRFHYYNAHFEWWWQLDNVKVEFVGPPGCGQIVCATAPGSVRPVADGSFGTPMKASRVNPTAIDLSWDVATCSSTGHHLLYGALANVSTATVTGASCGLGTSGSATWTNVPAGSLWFVVVGDNDASVEGSWGTTTLGERGGGSASGQCGFSTRDDSGSCP